MSRVFELKGSGITVEIGKLARQADGAVFMKRGDSVVLSTVVATKEEKDFIGFFPLTVEYRERTSAAGKFPGGFIKREGRLSDVEVLTSRLIDRSIRPLFPKYYFNEVQSLSTVYSFDGTFPLRVLSLLGASLSLVISQIPFMGPVGAVEVIRIDGKWLFNASYEEADKSDVRIIVAGTKNGICMVEGNCNNLSEDELVELLFLSHDEIKKQVEWQLEIQKEIGAKKIETESKVDWDSWKQKIKEALPDNYYDDLFAKTKEDSSRVMSDLKDLIIKHFDKSIETGIISRSILMFLFDLLLKEDVPEHIIKKDTRLDGRKFNEVRPILGEVGLLPCAHGSSVFQRGETQALASLTLGTSGDAQRFESLFAGEQERTFMLHYNFPPFSTGEVRPMRGVGRREIGHGYLAEMSFKYVLPSQEKFPYTIRSVADVLESNGSSSMASVCSTTLALMDAGVPIDDMIGGVAMGLLRDSSGSIMVLTDILGIEDALGLMDFKITGTEDGIMAIQMDIKDKLGLTKEVLSDALKQALTGRRHILGEMKKVLSESRGELSKLAPRVLTFKIDPENIGAVIGPAGKVIKEIIAKTNTQIDISDDGMVKIYSKDGESAKEAEDWIKILVGNIEVGATFDGVIRRIVDFGIFVELVPGKDGLVHISAISRDKQNDLEKHFKVNDRLKVKVVAYDASTGRVRLDLDKN